MIPRERRPGCLTEQKRGDASSARRDEGVGPPPSTDEQRRDATQIRGSATEGNRVDALRAPAAELLTSFFQRLTEFEGVTRAMLSGAELSAELVFRGRPERRVLLDFTAHPARVLVDDRTRPGQIVMAAEAEVMHQILTGELAAGIAFARRQVLLRGPAGRMARFLPLLGVAPLLYREHLADLGIDGFARPTGWAPLKETLMMEKSPQDQPLQITERSRLEELVYQRINGAAYAMGYAMGKMRQRLLKNLSLFDMMSAMSRGLDAAGAKKRTER